MKKQLIPLLVLFSLLFLPGLALAQNEAAPVTEHEEVHDQRSDRETSDQEQEVVVEDRSERAERNSQPSWTWIIGRNALAGGVTGGLIGLGLYLVTGRDIDPWLIGQLAGGGILIGAAVGVVELLVRSGDSYALEKTASLQWMERDMPTTYEIPVFKVDF